MPKGLAIETSGRAGSVALSEGGRVLAEESFPHGLKHAAEVVPILDRLCRAQGWGPRDVEELAISAGPGSFTGLRIAVTLAKTYALATGVKVVAVPTVRVLAENAPADARHVVIVLDAKRGQVYTARFERAGDGRWEAREEAHLDTVAAMLGRAPRPVHLLGEGIPYHREPIAAAAAADPGVVVCDEALWAARASVVARLGREMAQRGQFADVDRLTPLYIRPPEAEEKLAAAAAAATPG